MGMKRFLTVSAAAALATAMGTAQAGSITPDSVVEGIGVGETIDIVKTVTTDPGGVSAIDFYFLADNTGSMGGVIVDVASVAGDLLTALSGAYADAAFGVGRYFGDPTAEPDTFDSAYDVLTPITTVAADVTTGIGGWIASGGGDGPEANFYGLHQAATEGADVGGPGTGSGEATGWRLGSQKVILWFGDAPSHADTLSEAETIATLLGEDVIVIGFNSVPAGTGIDGSNDGDASQASDITAATGGALVNSFASVPVEDIVDLIVTTIGDVTATIDLSLIVSGGDTSGLDVSFACTDALGCDDVPGGESRELTMTVTGLVPGVYAFTVVAPGVAGAVEEDEITVGEPPVGLPAPTTLGLLGLALLGLAGGRLARRGA